MLLEFFFALGFAFIFSALTVYFRDLQHILGIVTMAWFYGTPIVYTVDMVPKQYIALFYLNPMTGIIGAYRDVLYYKQFPVVANLYGILIWSAVALIFGYLLFIKLQRNFVEEL
jgi:ABC-2 type transport system permease protein